MIMRIAAIFLSIAMATSVSAQSFEVRSGTATLTRNNRYFKVVRGTLLFEGDRLIVNEGFSFAIDYGAGLITARKGTTISFLELRRNRGCIRNSIYYTGQLVVAPLPFLCRESYLRLISDYGVYSFRGTRAVLNADAEQSAIAVEAGLVEAQAQGVSRLIPTGYGSITIAGKPPSAPIPFDSSLLLSELRIVPQGGTIMITGRKNPLNSVRVQGSDAIAKVKGKLFSIMVSRPIFGNSLQVSVYSPFGAKRVYVFPLPYPQRHSENTSQRRFCGGNIPPANTSQLIADISGSGLLAQSIVFWFPSFKHLIGI
jgi:hypothetical protein